MRWLRPIFDQRWPALAPPGPLVYLRAAIRLVFSQKRWRRKLEPALL